MMVKFVDDKGFIRFWTPASVGASETLMKATKAASEILRKQGKLNEVKKLQANLAEAQAEAAAALRKEP